jgi:response regulator RpfG family c-di-GMP phosphodiesterase
LEAVRAAVNEGEVFRYITKPWNNNDLRSVVYAGVDAARRGDAKQLTSHAQSNTGLFAPILIIDSDKQVYETCVTVVGKQGDVYFAGSLDEGLKQLQAIKQLGIVITTIKIGPHNTELLIKSIKTFHPSVVTILVSEMHDAELIVRLINGSQIFRCLFKPAKVETIQRVLMNAQIRHETLEKSSDLRARFDVPVPIEIQAAQKAEATAGAATAPPHRSWTQRFAGLFSRTFH